MWSEKLSIPPTLGEDDSDNSVIIVKEVTGKSGKHALHEMIKRQKKKLNKTKRKNVKDGQRTHVGRDRVLKMGGNKHKDSVFRKFSISAPKVVVRTIQKRKTKHSGIGIKRKSVGNKGGESGSEKEKNNNNNNNILRNPETPVRIVGDWGREIDRDVRYEMQFYIPIGKFGHSKQ